MATLGYSNQKDANTSEKILQHQELGTLLLKKSKRVRRLSIAVTPDKGVVVTIPLSVSFADAEAFAHEKAGWIKKAKSKIEKIAEAHKKTVFDDYTEFTTRFHKLKLIPEERANVHLKVTNGLMEVYYPKDVPLTHPAVQEVIRRCVEHTWKIEAHELLPTRVRELAAKWGFTYKLLKIKATRSCWGSCTYDNIINLSLHLMRMPNELVDYVILHELCHTIHKNHGPQFWQLLNSVTNGQARQLSKRTQQYNPRVI